jgi:hypothetical protein
MRFDTCPAGIQQEMRDSSRQPVSRERNRIRAAFRHGAFLGTSIYRGAHLVTVTLSAPTISSPEKVFPARNSDVLPHASADRSVENRVTTSLEPSPSMSWISAPPITCALPPLMLRVAVSIDVASKSRRTQERDPDDGIALNVDGGIPWSSTLGSSTWLDFVGNPCDRRSHRVLRQERETLYGPHRHAIFHVDRECV